jgi:dihydrofolate synthase / folylpolyglutamate synthase
MNPAHRGPPPCRLTYADAVGYIDSLLRHGVKLGLDRMHAMLAELGHPERGCRGALIAGTNGKGSTAAFLESILRAAGHHTGLTPSPHLRSYTERVQLDAQPMSESDFAATLAELRDSLRPVFERMGEPTVFELLVAMAIHWLAPRADRLAIEVGMGGRLDSTNALDLGVAVITNVTYDHRAYLGRTLRQIASEKAGIVKPGNVVITGARGAALETVESAAAKMGASDVWRLGREIRLRPRRRGCEGSELDLDGPGFSYRGLRISLLGSFQPANAALAVAAAHALGDATPEAVRAGLVSARWPGRLEIADRRLIFDCAHNQDGMRRLVHSLRQLLGPAPITVVFAAMADKEVDRVMTELRKLTPAHVVFTSPASAEDRALQPATLAEMWGDPASYRVPAAAALAEARYLAGPDGWVLVCGSVYLVGELR